MSNPNLPNFTIRRRKKRVGTKLTAREFYYRDLLRDAADYLKEFVGTHGDKCYRHDCDIPDRGRRLLASIQEALK